MTSLLVTSPLSNSSHAHENMCCVGSAVPTRDAFISWLYSIHPTQHTKYAQSFYCLHLLCWWQVPWIVRENRKSPSCCMSTILNLKDVCFGKAPKMQMWELSELCSLHFNSLHCNLLHRRHRWFEKISRSSADRGCVCVCVNIHTRMHTEQHNDILKWKEEVKWE